ncbi:MAG: glycosyltransferase family 2 protein [Candidatus Fimenecus sp.]
MLDIKVTVIMPTFNSEKTIRYSLDSIKNQNFDTDKLECLVIDGGSKDKTLEIAREYAFVKILQNPERVPEIAKLIGFKNAKGSYIIKMDSDEAFENADAISGRLNALNEFPDAHIAVANELKPMGNGVSNSYLNYCGDPFSYFIYKPQSTILKTYEKNISARSGEICLLKFKENEPRPIADGGTTTFDREFILKNFNECQIDASFISSVSDKILDLTNTCICVENDNVLHRSRSGFKDYIKKIRFRVINNIFTPAESGFSNRKISSSNRKLLFPFYVISFILPLLDSVKLTIKHKDFSFMLHPIYCYCTLFFIVWYYVLKIFHIKRSNKEY